LDDFGNIVTIRSPLTNLAVFLDRLGHYELAATIAGFAFSALTANDDLDTAAAIAVYAPFLGFGVGQYEPSRGPRNSSNPRRLSTTGGWHSSTRWRRYAR
jgi:hypothetical protein